MSSSIEVTTRSKQNTRRAYILDDEPQVGAFVCEILAASGMTTRQFSSPASFLSQFKIAQPELTVLDLVLGNQSDAVDVIRYLEILKYKGQVLLISGRDDTMLAEVGQIGERHGLAMLPPLRKPFRAHDLKERLAAVPEMKVTVTQTKSTNKIRINLDEALRKDWLQLWYQPKIDLKSFTICGAEALLRASHPLYGIITPADLLPPSGDPLYHPLTKFVIRRAMSDWKLFADRQAPIKLAVNLPASVMHAPDFMSVMRACMPTDSRFPGLIIEVTEDDIIRDTEHVREIATQLKLCNIYISIDDFGSQYSSLSRLLALPFVELKLDRVFVSNCASDPRKQAICQTVVDLAHRFDLLVCAEGVERIEDLHCLIAMGCDTAQGYLFAPPMDADKFAQMLRGEASRLQARTYFGGERLIKIV